MLLRCLTYGLLLFMLACSRSTAGINIGPGEVFVLGEYKDDAYRATLRNDGPQAVTILLIGKVSRDTQQRIQLAPDEETTLSVAGSQEVRMLNPTNRKAEVLAVLSEGVEGMRMVNMDGSPRDRFADAPPASEQSPPQARTDVGPPFERITKVIPVGQQLIIGEGTVEEYAATIRVGDNIEVSGRDKRSGRQLKAFGLRGKETVDIRPYENLYLINTGQRPVRVRISTTRAVAGARLEASDL